MKIFLISDPLIPVPPMLYGGIERVVYDLACELHRRGHEVQLMAGPGSRSPGALIEFGTNAESPSKWEKLGSWLKVSTQLLKRASRTDVVHNFGRLAYLVSIGPMSIRKINTYMRKVHYPNIQMTGRMGFKNMLFTGVSDFISTGGQRGGGDWKTIYNGIDLARYSFSEHVDPEQAPLAFLGRLERCKGAHVAIAVAKSTNRKLLIAGNISTLPEEKEYFENELKPLIDGNQIEYIGPVNDEKKNVLLGTAAALLSPIEWDEPFPIIVPESFACGTPILAYARGGMPEGIDHGRTGFLSRTRDEMIQHVRQVSKINRKECRLMAEKRFSIEAITDEYLKVYSTQN
jgi:glycosyltransferase involved in cell wall biosynthesis